MGFNSAFKGLNTAQHVSGIVDGKPEAATAVVAPDDGHDNARNMLSCI